MVSNSIIAGAGSERYHTFSLSIQHRDISLLPSFHVMIVDTVNGNFIVFDSERHIVAADGTFGREELPLILALLHAWPSYVENTKLLQIVTGRPLSEIVEILDIASDSALEPLRRLTEACRCQCHIAAIDIEDMGQGYKLGRFACEKGALVV